METHTFTTGPASTFRVNSAGRHSRPNARHSPEIVEGRGLIKSGGEDKIRGVLLAVLAVLATGNVNPSVMGGMLVRATQLTIAEWSTGDNRDHESVIEVAEIVTSDADADVASAAAAAICLASSEIERVADRPLRCS